MPQLDNLIIVPQIVWLFISFTSFYFLLSFYFLPLFLKLIKSKTFFIAQIELEIDETSTEILNKYKHSILKLISNVKIVKNQILLKVFIVNDEKVFMMNLNKILNFIINSTKELTLYCNVNLLAKIFIFPNSLNIKK